MIFWADPRRGASPLRTIAVVLRFNAAVTRLVLGQLGRMTVGPACGVITAQERAARAVAQYRLLGSL